MAGSGPVELDGLRVSRLKLKSLLKNTSCDAYLVESAGEMLLVDSGSDPNASSILDLASRLPGRLSTVVNTHVHYEQIAGNAAVAEAAGAEILVPAGSRELAEGFGEVSRKHRDSIDLDELSHFFTHAEVSMFMNYYSVQHASLAPFIVSRTLSEGDIMDIGDARFEVVRTPGHSADSLCLLDVERGVMFSGDAVCVDELAYAERMPFEPGEPGDLTRLLDSLDRMENLPFDTMFSSAGFTRGDALSRVNDTLTRYSELEKAALEVLRVEPATAVEIAASLFPDARIRIDSYRHYLVTRGILEKLQAERKVAAEGADPVEASYRLV